MGADDSTESVLHSQLLRPLQPTPSSAAASSCVPVQLRCFYSTGDYCHDVTTMDVGGEWGPGDATSTGAVPS